MEAALRGRRSDPASEVKGRGYRRPAAGNSPLTSRGKLSELCPLFQRLCPSSRLRCLQNRLLSLRCSLGGGGGGAAAAARRAEGAELPRPRGAPGCGCAAPVAPALGARR